MRGTLREKRPGQWELRVQTGRDPLTGKHGQSSRTVRGTRREAEKALAAFYVEIVERPSAPPGKRSMAELLDAWFELASADLAPKTAHEYSRIIQARIRPALGHRPVRQLDASEVDRFYRALQRQEGLSAASIRHVHAILSKALGQAVKWDWITESPIPRTSPPPVRRTEVTPPEPAEVARLLEAAQAHDADFGMLLLLAATTGARRGELCALRWRDIDLDVGSLTIRRALSDVGGHVEEKDTKTHAARRLRLDAATVEELRRHRRAAEGRAAEFAVEVVRDAFVCSHAPDGSSPLRPDQVTRYFGVVRQRLGLRRVRFHDLRHFMATTMLGGGVPLRTVSGRLGHANATTTLGVYAHFIEATDGDAAELMRKVLDGFPADGLTTASQGLLTR